MSLTGPSDLDGLLADQHQAELAADWSTQTAVEVNKTADAMLEELVRLGFSWRDIARMTGVSVPIVREWAIGGGVPARNLHALAALRAACSLLADRHSVNDVASWFETPLAAGVAVTPIDLYAAGQPLLVLEYAEHGRADAVLDSFDPDWRTRTSSDYETFVDVNGRLGLRPV